MAYSEALTPEFEITHRDTPSDVLLCGFSSFGLAGLTAVDYLVDHMGLEQTGHLTVDGLPVVTPFEDGRPRHHTRFFSRSDLDVTVLVGELFVPAVFGTQFSDAILDWTEANGVEEVAVLAGIPVAHGPDEHRVFYIATDDYRETRLGDTEVPPMGRGFFDGTNAALVERGIDSPLGVGVFVTPVHAQVPDVEAAIRLVETANDVYDLGVTAAPLESFAAEVRQYYAELAERLRESEPDLPDDRMYM
ncbi:proteasome assembly chaperone family protein [Haloferax sp. S1W]|uniref:proteasome assembly chaperone family protein n=1 Tax=Haloferax sp. S1W TaxID=3377110 RepID=UPI0037C9FB80